MAKKLAPTRPTGQTRQVPPPSKARAASRKAKARPEVDEASGPDHVSVRLLGTPQLRPAGSSTWLSLGDKKAALLARLAISGPCTREQLAAQLWPSAKDPLNSLANAVAELKAAAGTPCVVGTIPDLAPGVQTDLHSTQPINSVDELPYAELLGGLVERMPEAFNDWLRGVRAQRKAEHQRRVHRFLQQINRDGRPLAQAIEVAEWLVAFEQLDEAAWQALIELHVQAGDEHAALRAAEECRRALALPEASTGAEGAAPTDAALSARTRQLLTAVELGQFIHLNAQSRRTASIDRPLPLVSREAEWAALHDAWAQGLAVWLEGESGIGKSRLLHELAQRWPHSALVTCQRNRAQVPYALLAEVLRRLWHRGLPGLKLKSRSELARLWPEFGPMPTHPAHLPAMTVALGAALQAAGRSGLNALLVDDAQWADAPSLTLLQAALPAAPILRVAVAAQPCLAAVELFGGTGDDAGTDSCTAVPPAGRQAGDTRQSAQRRWLRLRPTPWDGAAIVQMILTLQPKAREAASWAAVLAARTLGNPVHVIETLLALQAALGHTAFNRPPPSGELPVPGTLPELVSARLAALGPQAVELAQLAAFAGDVFSATLATEVTGRTELALAPVWRDLSQQRVLRDGALVHDTLREPLMALVPQALRPSLHAKIAAHAARQGAPDAEVALHWHAAERWAEAGEAYASAAVQAKNRNTRAKELFHADAASECFARAGQHVRAFDLACTAFDAALDQEGAEAVLARLVRLGSMATTPGQQVWVETARARHELIRYQPQAALEATDRALVHVATPRRPGQPTVQRPLVLRALWMRSSALAMLMRHEEAVQVLAQGPLRLSTRAEPEKLRLQLDQQSCVGYVHAWGPRPALAVQAYTRALDFAERLEDASEAATLGSALSVALTRTGDFRAALDASLRARRWHRKLGVEASDVALAGRITCAVLHTRLTLYNEALTEFFEVRATLRPDSSRHLHVTCAVQLARAWLELGRPDLARHTLSELPTDWTAPHVMAAATYLEVAYRQGLATVQDLGAVQAMLGPAHSASVRMAVHLLAMRIVPPEAALAQGREIRAQALALGEFPAAKAAAVLMADAWLRLGQPKPALRELKSALRDIETRRPMGLYFGEVGWLWYRALRDSGQDTAARDVLASNCAWLRDVALPSVPKGHRPAFLKSNAVNAALLAAEADEAAQAAANSVGRVTPPQPVGPGQAAMDVPHQVVATSQTRPRRRAS